MTTADELVVATAAATRQIETNKNYEAEATEACYSNMIL